MPQIQIKSIVPVDIDNRSFMRVSLETYNDWKGTPEGHLAMENAREKLDALCVQMALSNQSSFQWLDNDKATWTLPCMSRADALEISRDLQCVLATELNAYPPQSYKRGA